MNRYNNLPKIEQERIQHLVANAIIGLLSPWMLARHLRKLEETDYQYSYRNGMRVFGIIAITTRAATQGVLKAKKSHDITEGN